MTILYHSLVTPNMFFGEMTPPSISLIGVAAFRQVINVGEEVYTINIQPTSDYLDIEAFQAISHELTPTSALHSEPLPTNEAELFTKVVPETYQYYFHVFSQEEANNMLPHHEFDHYIHLKITRHLTIAISTHSLAQSSVSCANSLMTCLARGSSDHLNCQVVHLFSL